jgi:hypothetical protein
MNTLVQIIGSSLGMEIGPQKLHELLAMKLVVRLQGEDFQDRDWFPPFPSLFIDGLTVY